MGVIDRSPCTQCTHEDICKFKVDHILRVNRVEEIFEEEREHSIDLIYVSCPKFQQQSAILKRSIEAETN